MSDRKRHGRLALALAAAVLAGAWQLWSNARERLNSPPERDIAMAALGADVGAEFARAQRSRPFRFPRDHALHEAFRSEWWYFTGHLQDEAERAYGFQLTLFRFELDATTPTSVSAWRTPRVLLGHFAVTDIARQRFHAFERLSRALPAIGGASVAPPAIWLDDWRIEFDPQHEHWTLRAAQDGVQLELTLTHASAVVAQGDAGLSRKSAAAGNASYYYSVPRLHATGSLALPSGTQTVSGSAWLDREWSSSALAVEQIGWDWFALQLDDGSSLMFYRLRRRDGTSDPHSAGSYVASDGQVRALSAAEVAVSELAYWRSAASGRRYPGAWRLQVTSLGLDVELRPRLKAQEWQGAFHYWEGAVNITATGDRTSRRGLGYVELTGY